MSFILKTAQEIRQELAERARQRRLAANLSQEGLARRAGISAGTVKRFEKTGHISIDSLLQIAFVLESAEAFESVFQLKQAPVSIDELLKTPHAPKRGRLK